MTISVCDACGTQVTPYGRHPDCIKIDYYKAHAGYLLCETCAEPIEQFLENPAVINAEPVIEVAA